MLSREVTWGLAGSSRELAHSMPDLAHRLSICSSDYREEVRPDLGLVLPSLPQAAHLAPGLLIFPSHRDGFARLQSAALGGQVDLLI